MSRGNKIYIGSIHDAADIRSGNDVRVHDATNDITSMDSVRQNWEDIKRRSSESEEEVDAGEEAIYILKGLMIVMTFGALAMAVICLIGMFSEGGHGG